MFTSILSVSFIKLTVFFVLIFAYCFVSYQCHKSYQRSNVIGWYSGVQNSPIVQTFIWVGASPFLLWNFLYRKRGKTLDDTLLSNSDFYLASKARGIFHKPGGCDFVARINPNTLVKFSSTDEAKKRGFRPCNWCFPAG